MSLTSYQPLLISDPLSDHCLLYYQHTYINTLPIPDLIGTCDSWALPLLPISPLMFSHFSFPASVVHHYHHTFAIILISPHLVLLSLHCVHLAKSQVYIRLSTYSCLRSRSRTFVEKKNPKLADDCFPLKIMISNHMWVLNVAVQCYLTSLTFPFSQIMIS